MTGEEIQALLDAQRAFFNSGATLSVDFRIKSLRKLYDAVKAHESDVHAALTADLGKSAYEGFMCESGLALTEISYMIKHTRNRAHAARTIRLAQLHAGGALRQHAHHESVELPVPADHRPARRRHRRRQYRYFETERLFAGDQLHYRAHCRRMLRARARGGCHGRPCGKYRAARAEIRLHLLHGKPERR